MTSEPDSDAQQTALLAFLNALNDGGGLAEATAYLDAGWDINAAIVPIIQQTLLHHAAINRRLDIVEMLADKGADLNVRDAFGMTPMHMAVMHDITAILMKWQEPDFPCARLLYERGATIDPKNMQGMTPRDIAGAHGSLMADLFDEVMIK